MWRETSAELRQNGSSGGIFSLEVIEFLFAPMICALKSINRIPILRMISEEIRVQ